MELSQVNLTDPDLFQRGTPHDMFRVLRREAPVYRHPEPNGPGFWAVTKYHDLKWVSKNPALFSSERQGTLREDPAATDLPVSADLEKGKGDSPESAGETIFAADAAGLAGCSIEDYSGDPENPIYEFGLAVERVAAAADAARSLKHDFVFTARAEKFLSENLGGRLEKMDGDKLPGSTAVVKEVGLGVATTKKK